MTPFFFQAGWAENDFNLLDYIGKDDSPADYDEFQNSYNPDEEEMREKDRYYSALQYNNVMLNGDDQYGRWFWITVFVDIF